MTRLCLRGHCFHRLNEDAVHKSHLAIRRSRYTIARDNNAGQVKRIGGSDGDVRLGDARRRLTPRCTQQLDGFGQSVLFAEGPRDKTAAADFSARFQSAQHRY